MFLKDRIWRLAVQKLVTGRSEDLNNEERKLLGGLIDIIYPKKEYHGEEIFFDQDSIIKMLRKVEVFRRSSSASNDIFLPEAYDQETKTVGPKTISIKRKQAIIFEGKYANKEELQGYFDLRYRLHDAADRTAARFEIRSRKLSPNDADMQIIFYKLSLVPSFKQYDKRTEKSIHGFIDLRGEDWFIKDTPDGDNKSRKEQNVRAMKNIWSKVSGTIEEVDPDVESKTEPFLSRLYAVLKRTFEGLIFQAKMGETEPFAKIRTMKYGKEVEDSRLVDVDREVSVGFLAVAGNPLNWGHLLAAYMPVKILGLDVGVMRVQGEIGYKKLLASERVSVKDRHGVVKAVLKDLFPLLRYTDLGSEPKNDQEGFEEFIRFLELNADRHMHGVYLLGIENEERVENYTRQFYQMMKKYKDRISDKHRITIGWIQRGEYGKRITKDELDATNERICSEEKGEKALPVVLIKDKGIDLNVSSTYYRMTQDGAFVPKQVHEHAKKNGYYGHPPLDPRTGMPVTKNQEDYFRLQLQPVAKSIANQIRKAIANGVTENTPLVSLDGGSGSGKSTIAEEVAKILSEDGIETEIIPLDMFLKDRRWRLAIQKIVTGRKEELTVEESMLLGDLIRMVKAKKEYLEEEDFFDLEGILKMFREVEAFRRSAKGSEKFFISKAYDQATKTVGPKTIPIQKKQVIIFEGKYANKEELQKYFDLRYRLHDAEDRTAARFEIRSRKLSPNDADMQIIFYKLSLVPSFEKYDQRTEKDIHGFIDLRGEKWFLKDTPEGGFTLDDETRFQNIFQLVKKINPNVSEEKLRALYSNVEFAKPVYSKRGTFRKFIIKYIEGQLETLKEDRDWERLYGQRGTRRITDDEIILYLAEHLHIKRSFFVEKTDSESVMGRNFNVGSYKRTLYVKEEFGDFIEFYLLVGNSLMRNILFGENENIAREVRRGVRILGQGSKEEAAGNKERGCP